MKRTVISSLVYCALLFCFHSPAFAFRCGDRIVSIGDSKAEVVLRCGEPASKDGRTEEIIEKSDIDRKHRTRISIEEWTYNFGPDKFIRIYQFKNGKLVDIRTGDYGR